MTVFNLFYSVFLHSIFVLLYLQGFVLQWVHTVYNSCYGNGKKIYLMERTLQNRKPEYEDVLDEPKHYEQSEVKRILLIIA